MAKHRIPTKGIVRRTYVQGLVEAKTKLEQANRDIDIWCESIGVELIRTDMLEYPILAAIVDNIIFIPKRFTWKQEVWLIAHEYCHRIYHPEVAAYKTLDIASITINERDANSFANALVGEDVFFT